MRALLILIALLGLTGWLLLKSRTDLAEARADLAAAEHAAKVLGSYYATAQAIEDRADDHEAETEKLEGADAPLSDYGRSVLDRVRQ